MPEKCADCGNPSERIGELPAPALCDQCFSRRLASINQDFWCTASDRDIWLKLRGYLGMDQKTAARILDECRSGRKVSANA